MKCASGVMRIEVPISETTLEVYLEGLKEYPDPACRPQRDSTGTLTVFSLDLDDVYRCATTRITNKLTVSRLRFETFDGKLRILYVHCLTDVMSPLYSDNQNY